ncbi:MAG TPA: sialidase family protein [bacterium]|nr:sialidase family protein [bacterium]
MSVNIIFSIFLSFFIFFTGCSNESAQEKDDAEIQDFDSADEFYEDADAAEEMTVKSIKFTISEEYTDIISSPSKHFAFPDVIKLKNGKFMVVYRSGSGHAEVSGKIYAHYSDDGETWSDIPEVVMDDPSIDDRDPSIVVLENGKVAMNWFKYRYPADYTEPWIHRVFFAASDDHGKNFSDPVQVEPGIFDYSGASSLNDEGIWVDNDGDEIVTYASSSHIVEDAGRLIIPGYGGNALNRNSMSKTPKGPIVFFISEDDGKTWHLEPVNAEAPENTWLQEPALVKISELHWILQVRTAYGSSPGGKGDLMQSTSLDGGKTWSGYRSLGFIAHAPELLKLNNGAIISSFRWLDWELDIEREAVSFVYSLDNGETWSDIIEIEDCGLAECGYPGTVELENNRIFVVYYTPGGAGIRARTISFSESY